MSKVVFVPGGLSRFALQALAAGIVATLWVRGLEAAETRQLTFADFMAQRGYDDIALKLDQQNHLYLHGKVNGRSADVLIDTGASFTAIDKSKAGGIQEVGELKHPVQGAFGKAEDNSSIVQIDRLELGKWPATNLHAVKLKLNERTVRVGSLIPRSSATHDMDVLLGLDFLQDYNAFLDYRTGKLFLRRDRPESMVSERIERTIRASGWEGIPLSLVVVENLLYVPAAFNGHPVTMIVDTGSMVTSIDINQLDQLGLTTEGQLGKSSGLGGKKSDWNFAYIR
jgi:predicted aspartyl protease